MFVIAVEGAKTEPQYFGMFNNQESVIHVNCLRGRDDSSPTQVLKRMSDHLRHEALQKNDEAWLVVDKDQWTDEQLIQLHDWAGTQNNHGFALSNPKFEYWLLLHFENGHGITTSHSCSKRLARYMLDYDKGIDPRMITTEMIHSAIRRASQRDTPQCKDWPRQVGSTVYRLVQHILGFKEQPKKSGG